MALRWLVLGSVALAPAALQPPRADETLGLLSLGHAYSSQQETSALKSLERLVGFKVAPQLQASTKCVVLVSLQYFVVHTAILIFRAVHQAQRVGGGGKTSKPAVQAGLEKVVPTASLLPMVGALFLAATEMGGPMAAERGEESLHLVMSAAVVAGFVALLFRFWNGMEGSLLSGLGEESGALSFVASLLQHAAIAVTIVATCWFHDRRGLDKLEPMLACLICLAIQYFVVYTILLLASWSDEVVHKKVDGRSPSLLTQAARAAASEQTLGPMLSVLIMALYSRALAIRAGTFQPWTQTFFFSCNYGLLGQTLLSAMAAVVGGSSLRERLPGLLEFLAMIRWGAICCLYAFAACAIVGELAPANGSSEDASSVLLITLWLVLQYFVVHMLCFIVAAVQQIRGERPEADEPSSSALAMPKRLADVLVLAKDAVMFCPMMAVLFLATRKRAMEFYGRASPPEWVQGCMHICMWASFVQLTVVALMAILALTGQQVTVWEDATARTEKVKMKQACASFLVCCQCICLLSLHAAVLGVIYGTLKMSPLELSILL